MKELVVLLVLVSILLVIGCAVTRVKDHVPAGEPKGFVKFYVMIEDIEQRQGFPKIYSQEVYQGRWPIINPAWSRKDRYTLEIAKTPGIHDFSIEWAEDKKDIQVTIEKGKVIPVRIGLTAIKKDIALGPSVDYTNIYFKIYTITNTIVPVDK